MNAGARDGTATKATPPRTPACTNRRRLNVGTDMTGEPLRPATAWQAHPVKASGFARAPVDRQTAREPLPRPAGPAPAEALARPVMPAPSGLLRRVPRS